MKTKEQTKEKINEIIQASKGKWYKTEQLEFLLNHLLEWLYQEDNE